MTHVGRLRRVLGGGLATAVLLSLLTATGAGAQSAPASFVLSGSGWGHGVGLSQYGARGQAAAGRSVAQILAHYYTGTSVAAQPDAADLDVQILRAASPTATTTGGLMRLRIGASVLRDVPEGATVTFTVSGTDVVAKVGGTPLAQAPSIAVEWEGTRFYRPGGPAAITDVPGAGGRYRHGRMLVTPLSGQVNVVNVVRLHDEYLYGIAEMPSSWGTATPAALDAQAIIARGYALANQRVTRKSDCACHVYDEVKSQKFTGWSKENEIVNGTNYGALWKQAVDRTSVGTDQGKVVVNAEGKLVTTYYFSSSGGRTQNSEDVWSAALPHLRSVPDPWSLNPSNNPTYAAWTRTLSQAAVAKAFGLSEVVSLDLSSRTAGGGVRAATATSATGTVRTLTGEQLRSTLGLPATWVRRPELRLAGADRWQTSVAAARHAFPSGRTVVIVSGVDANLVDGLVAGPLARSLSAPVLLVARDSVPTAIRSELTRRGANRAVIVGGTGAVSSTAASELQGMGLTVERVAGADRFATAAAVARRVGSPSRTAVVASGEQGALVDALSASGAAGATGRPIVLVRRDSVPAPTSSVLQELGITGTTCVGGTGVLSEDVRRQLPSCYRAAGADRYGTAVAVANAFRSLVPATQVAVTSGHDGSLVDAMGAGTFGRLVLVVPRSGIASSTKGWLQRTPSITRLDVVGGVGAVPPSVVMLMREA